MFGNVHFNTNTFLQSEVASINIIYFTHTHTHTHTHTRLHSGL